MNKIPISATIITLNEEKNIVRAILSLDWVDEIIVVDSFSSDKTLELAKSMGAKTYQQKFLGHFQQKQFALNLAKYDWIISLDADEVVSSNLKNSVVNLLNSGNPTFNGYKVNRRNFHFNRWIKHGGWYPDKKLRIFNKNFGYWGGENPHDIVVLSGKPGYLTGDLWHYTFRDLSHNVQANNFYSSIGADILLQKNRRFSLCSLLARPMLTFLRCYLYRRGFLDGLPGFIIAIGAAYSTFLKYAKLWELRFKKSSL